jgi:hypothetical protein
VQEDFNDSIKVFEQLNEEKAGAEQEAVECRTLAEEYQQLYQQLLEEREGAGDEEDVDFQGLESCREEWGR